MSFFRWRLRRSHGESFESRPQAATTTRLPPIQDTRHYLEQSDYQLPKDAEEDDRIDFQHHTLFHAIGTHYVAPLSPPLPLILDVGTGTGVWASEMARAFPGSVVVGVDLSTRSFRRPLPDNCFCCPGDVLAGLPFPDAFFA